MAGYCTSVRPYFHNPQASENTAQEFQVGQGRAFTPPWLWLALHLGYAENSISQFKPL